MTTYTTYKRRTFLKFTSLLAAQTPFSLLADAKEPDAGTQVRFGDAAIQIDVDNYLCTSIRCTINGSATQLTRHDSSEYLLLSDGRRIANFKLIHAEEKPVDDNHGEGKTLVLTGVSANGVQKTVRFNLYERYPGFVTCSVSYLNQSQKTLAIKAWVNGDSRIQSTGRSVPAFWSFSGGTYPDRRDWVQPVRHGFEQANFMGMTASDYGGGTPVVDVWHRDGGLAVGHIELVPKLVSLPVRAEPGAVSIAISGEVNSELKPGGSLETLNTFITVHRGDYFATLDSYRRVMADRGLQAPRTPAGSYQPIWCAWGYERDFSMALVEGTLVKAKQLGLEWAVIDDGWQTANGDWYVDVKKFPRGEEDWTPRGQKIKAAGLKPRLWFSPLAVGPGTDLLHDHTDMLLLDKDGAVQNITWWNCFYLCPAYEPTVTYSKKLIRKILGEWGFAGVKIDGQHLNGVAPCFNPAHHHARPEESVEKLQDFFRAIYETAMEVNPEAVIEICPCGTSYAFHNMPYMNQAPASDPLSSWQVRHKGKTLKALMGPSAPFAGDHVELSDGGNDFASSVGIGAVVSTKFTWPIDPKLKDSFLLTADNEVLWQKWIGLYNAHLLPTGTYRGNLYDIGFDKPEAHAIQKDGRMYYAFYAGQWHGRVDLRGLEHRHYTVRDYFNDVDLGQISAGGHHLDVSFKRFLLLEVVPT
jgi:alpha-galactosidase